MRSHNSYACRGITSPIVYRMSWGFACLQLNPIRPGHMFYIENEFRNFPGELKIYLKILVNCQPSIIVFFPPGVNLQRESSPLQVMWGGAVNRQPGYRARNLQRRGFLTTEIIPDARASCYDYSLINFWIFKNKWGLTIAMPAAG